jgi:hypothetical protein
MTYRGTVLKGTVILPPEAKLADGTQVRVEPLEGASPSEPVGKKLLALAGILEDLPADFAENHDHYIHGTPKRQTP